MSPAFALFVGLGRELVVDRMAPSTIDVDLLEQRKVTP